jgi:hypothetical protein
MLLYRHLHCLGQKSAYYGIYNPYFLLNRPVGVRIFKYAFVEDGKWPFTKLVCLVEQVRY